jgi:AcrR family transcriptional regulator
LSALPSIASAAPIRSAHAVCAAPARAPLRADHRIRVAEQKRERMRERLIDATLAAYLHCEPGRHPVVDDVVRIAEVSRGSFYKHFDAIDEVFDEIGWRMAQDMLASYSRLAAPLIDSAARVALGPLMALTRSAMEPRHGAFVARVDFTELLAGEPPHSHLVALSLLDSRRREVLQFDAIDAAVDLVIGVSLEGARRIVRTRALDGAYIRELTAMVLRGLGVAPGAADKAVAKAWQRLSDESATLHWWKPLSPVGHPA